jgi:glycine cleavage system H protein
VNTPTLYSAERFYKKEGTVKEINELVLPADVRYTKDHEWARADGANIRIGITDYAQDQLGDIVYVEVPELGATFEKGEQCGTLESVKAAAEMYTPVSGEIVAVNTALEESPDLVNKDPYAEGWIALVKPKDPTEMDGLMTNDTYLEMLKGMEE